MEGLASPYDEILAVEPVCVMCLPVGGCLPVDTLESRHVSPFQLWNNFLICRDSIKSSRAGLVQAPPNADILYLHSTPTLGTLL